ncbi:MAG: putative Ig domain-containing protein, partial [Burkholderiales bacterium]|nr:putative Ig domain-containing protein [Burkholderiales bacterium]
VAGRLRWATDYFAAGIYRDVLVTVSDGATSSSEKFDITVTPTNQAPVIVRIPPLGTQEQRLLTFTLTGADPDGDVLTYVPLAPLPQGAEFDRATGVFTWQPGYDQAGGYDLQFAVRDPLGLQDAMTVHVDVADVNRTPVLSFTNHQVALGDTLQFKLVGSDPDTGTTLAFSARGLPEGATFNAATGQFSWTPTAGQVGDYLAVVGVTDGITTVERGLQLRVTAQPAGPVPTIVLTPSFPAVPGQPVAINVLADAFSALASRTLSVNGAPLALDASGHAVFTAPASGIYQLTATATDLDGYAASSTMLLRVRDPLDHSAPVVALDTGLGGAHVVSPLAITGSVADSNLERWTLAIARTGSDGFTTIASGAGPIAGTLATLDPARYAPGFYQLRLTATDVAGRSAETATAFELDATNVAGGYTRSNVDFSATLAGHTLDFTRRYDSFTADQAGSFGNGWRLAWRDLGVTADVPTTGSEASGVYNPLRWGTRVFVDTPDGGRAGFTFQPVAVTGQGFTYYEPRWVPDAGVTWQLQSAKLPLQQASGKFYSLDDGSAYNPAALAGQRAQYTLVDTAGTRWDIQSGQGLTGITYADGVRLDVNGSGVTVASAAGGEAIVFTNDSQGRLSRVTAPDGRVFDYGYDSAGNLVSARDLSAGTSQRYGYANPAAHLLTLATAPGSSGQAIAYGDTVSVRAVDGDLGAALSYLSHDTQGTLAAGGEALYSLAVRASEVQLPQGGAFLLGVRVQATSGALAPAMPVIDGAIPVVSGSDADGAFAIFRITADGLKTLRIAGSGAGDFRLSLFAAGDVNGDSRVDGSDAAALMAARGTRAGEAGFLRSADINRDGQVNATDAQLLFANLGFAPNQGPTVGAGSGLTHVDLLTQVPVASFLSDPEGDPLSFRIVSSTHGVATLSGDGTRVLFRPEAGFAGDATFTVIADDGFTQSAAGDITVHVSDAPLLRMDFTQRNPTVALGGRYLPTVTGDFADQLGVVLDSSYVTLSVSNPTTTRLVANQSVIATAQGFSMLTAQRGGIAAATALVLGEPNRFENLQLFSGLDIYPHAVTLVPGTGFKPLTVNVPGGSNVTAATAYVAGNDQVVSVDAAGVVHGLAVGDTEVTVVYNGAEFRVPVRVRAPEVGSTTLGTLGGAVATPDGVILAIAPNALAQPTTVAITRVDQASLPMNVPQDFSFLGGFKIDMGATIATPAQLAIPVPDSVPVGTRLYLFRAAELPNEQGQLEGKWFEDEVAVVGADHIARTSSPPWPGVLNSGTWMLGMAGANISLAKGTLTVNVPIGMIPFIAAPGIGGVATYAPTLAVSFNVSQLHVIAIPVQGLPIVTPVGVHLNPGVTTAFDVSIDQPAAATPQSPIILSKGFEFRNVNGQVTPVMTLSGVGFTSTSAASLGSRVEVQFSENGHTESGVLVGSVTTDANGLQHLAVRVPQSIILGLAKVTVARIDQVPQWDECTHTVKPLEQAYLSLPEQLPAPGSYVVSALRTLGQVGIYTQGNPAAGSLAGQTAALQLVATIPVGYYPCDTALTTDHTRAYVTVSGNPDGRNGLALVDLVAMQQVKIKDATDPASTIIKLPSGSRPFWVALDPGNHYAYVTEEDPQGGGVIRHGLVYVVDIDPNSPTFNQYVKTIDVGPAPFGLRELVVSEDGKKLYVAAPNRTGYDKPLPSFEKSAIYVINVDSADRPEQPNHNPKHYWEVLGAVPTGDETYALRNSGDPDRILFTNRYFDNTDAVSYIDVKDLTDTPLGTAHALLKDNPNPVDGLNGGLTLGGSNNSFDVNNAGDVVVIPADAFKSVLGHSHPEYMLVAGYNRYQQGIPSSDPDYALTSPGSGQPSGSNIGIVRDGLLIAATTPIPIGVLDNLALASGYNYLFAAFRGVDVAIADPSVPGGVRRSTGAVMAYNLVNMIGQVEAIYNNNALTPAQKARMSRFPIEQLTDNAELLPLQEDLQGVNVPIDIKADYRVIGANFARGEYSFGVPYVMDGFGHYIDAQNNVLPYWRDAKGNWYLVSWDANNNIIARVPYTQGVPPGLQLSPNAPFATGGSAQGLSSHPTQVAPGPRIVNQFDFGRSSALNDRNDMGVKDLLDKVLGDPQNCPPDQVGSTVQMDTGVVNETHALASYQSLGQTQQLVLNYDSLAADPRQIINFSFEHLGAELTAYLPHAKPEELSDDGKLLMAVQITATGEDGKSVTTATQYWKIAPGQDTITAAMLVDFSSLPSGNVYYTVTAKLAGKDRISNGTRLNTNGQDSAFGRGWSLAGVQQLTVDVDGGVTIADGNGNAQHYNHEETPPIQSSTCVTGTQDIYRGADDNQVTLKKNAAGEYERTLEDGSVYTYSAPTKDPATGKTLAGHLIKVADRYNNVTRYDYDAKGNLTRITDPVGLKTEFGYSGKHVTSITDPAGRITRLVYSGDDLVKVIDPDQSFNSYGYDSLGHLTTSSSKLQATDTHIYDSVSGRLVEVDRADGSVTKVTPWQLNGLTDPALTTDKANPALASTKTIESFTATLKMANGNVRVQTMDEHGRVLSEKDSMGALETFVRDAAGNVTKTIEADGAFTESTYDARGNRLTLTDDYGTTSFTYDGKYNRVTSTTDSLGHATHYQIDAKGDNIGTTNADGTQTLYTYLPQGMLSTSTDAMGRQTAYFYDNNGRLAKVRYPDTSFKTYEYDLAGNASAMVDENGHRTQYVYDAMNRLVRTITADPDGAGPQTPSKRSSTYDAAGNMLTQTDELGAVTTMTYDQLGRLTSTIDRTGAKTTRDYDVGGNLKTLTDGRNNQTTYEYDLRNRVTKETNALLGEKTYTYDGDSHQASSITDEANHTTQFEYDDRGRLTRQVDANNDETVYTYDGANNRTSVTDANNHATTFVYDAMNRLLETTDALHGTSTVVYDPVGNIVATLDALLRKTVTEFDLRDRPVRQTDPLNGVKTWAYDAAGNLIKSTDALGRETRYGYDNLNRRISITLPDPDGSSGPLVESVTTMAYDDAGRMIALTDALGHATQFAYDAMGRLAQTIDALGKATTKTYDENGNVVKLVDALGAITLNEYDALNRLTKTTLPDPDGLNGPLVSPERTFEYDEVGNLVKATDALHHATIYGYDAVGRQVSMTDAAAGVTGFEYDHVGNLLAIVDPLAHRTEYAYDALNRRVSETLPGSGGSPASQTLTAYDAVGNVREIVDARGYATAYTYDALNRQITRTDALNGVATLAYDKVGNLVAATDEEGRTTRFVYDDQDRRVLAIQPNPAGGSSQGPVTRYTYDAGGNLIALTDALDHKTEYAYDELNRQTKTTYADGSFTSQAYDAVGHIVRTTDETGATTTHTYDALGRVIRITEADPDGSGPLAAPVTLLAYDGEGNLVQSTDPRGNVTKFTYDALNRRVDRIDALNQVSTLHYDKVGHVIESIDETGRRTAYEVDAQGRTLKITDADPDGQAGAQAAPVTRYTYDAMGNVLTVTDALNHVTRHEYDKLGRKVKTTDALNGVFTLAYDKVGNIVSSTDALGRHTVSVYDALDRAIEVRQPDPDGAGSQAAPVSYLSYDAVGNLLTMTDAIGAVTTYVYDDRNRAVKMIDALNGVMRTGYDAAGRVASVTDALGRVTTTTYDKLGRVTSITAPDPDGSGAQAAAVTRFAYDAAGNLVRRTDALGHVTQYGYDALDRRKEVIDAAGQSATMGYDEVGRLTSSTDVMGNATHYAYDLLGRLVSTTRPDPDGTGGQAAPVIRYGYDAVGNLLSVTDALDGVTSFTYDDLNRRLTTTDALHQTSSVAYDAMGNLLRSTDAAGRATFRSYDALDRLVSQTDPDPDGAAGPLDAPVTQFRYDANGRQVERTDALNHSTTTEYDKLGRTVAVTDALNGVTQLAYDAVGNLVTSTDALGRATHYAYDGMNRRIGVLQPDPDGSGPQTAPATVVAYDAVGNVTSMTDPLGHTTQYGYDVLDRNTTVTDALNQVSRRLYDKVGNLVGSIDTAGELTTYGYDALYRRISLTQPDPDGNGAQAAPVTRYGYDANDNVTSVTDALGHTTRTEYDALNRASTVTDARNGATTIERDAVGNVTSVKDALGRITRYGYDNLDRRVSTTDPMDRVSRSAYDAVGNLLSTTDALNQVTRYDYDALNRNTTITDAMSGVTRLGYDAVGNLVTSTDALGNVRTDVYDGLNRRIEHREPDPDGSGGPLAAAVSHWSYDLDGNLVASTDPLGKVTSRTYDALNRLLTTTDPLNGVNQYGYDAQGNLKFFIDADHYRTDYAYDALGRRVVEMDAFGALTTRSFDAVGNLLMQKDRLGRTTSYAYDELNRRTSEQWQDPQGQTTRTTLRSYDAAGQLLGVTDPDASYAFSYDLDGRVLSQDNAGTTGQPHEVTNYAYDELGRRTRATQQVNGATVLVTTTGYDALSRTTEVSQSGSAAGAGARVTLSYDAIGQTLGMDRYVGASTVAAVTTRNSWDAAGRVLEIRHANGSGTINDITHSWDAAGHLLATASSDGSTQYSYDARGQLTGVDFSFQPDESFGYDANGNPTVTST